MNLNGGDDFSEVSAVLCPYVSLLGNQVKSKSKPNSISIDIENKRVDRVLAKPKLPVIERKVLFSEYDGLFHQSLARRRVENIDANS